MEKIIKEVETSLEGTDNKRISELIYNLMIYSKASDIDFESELRLARDYMDADS